MDGGGPQLQGEGWHAKLLQSVNTKYPELCSGWKTQEKLVKGRQISMEETTSKLEVKEHNAMARAQETMSIVCETGLDRSFNRSLVQLSLHHHHGILCLPPLHWARSTSNLPCSINNDTWPSSQPFILVLSLNKQSLLHILHVSCNTYQYMSSLAYMYSMAKSSLTGPYFG